MTYWIIFHNDTLLLYNGALPQAKGDLSLPEGLPISLSEIGKIHTLPSLDENPCKAFGVNDKQATAWANNPSYQFVGLRASYDILPLSHYLMAGKARELIHFDDTVRFCSLCGSPMEWHTDISKRCTTCQREVWPQISTAIIVRITRGDEILLVRSRNFRGNYYGLVAGFLETGETLEECVRREVKEETNLDISHIRYFANQPWPYPSGQMIGFTAEYAGGTLHRQDEELSHAAFFHRNQLPEIPHRLSMARMLIDDWLDNTNLE